MYSADACVKSTIMIYKKILAEKKAIPSKFHYTFNLRDVSKVFQGICMCKDIGTKDDSAKLWLHECSRVFCDRLINEEDRKWFNEEA